MVPPIMAMAEVVSARAKTRVDNTAEVLKLLDAGHTVPFIVRYRAGMIGTLTADAVRTIEHERDVYTAAQTRRDKVLAALTATGKVIDARLRSALANAATVAEIDEVYAPFKPDGKKTKAAAARAAGLGDAADQVLSGKWFAPKDWRHLGSEKEVFEGVQHICADAIALDPETRQHVRDAYDRGGSFNSRASAASKKAAAGAGAAAVAGSGKDDSRKRKRQGGNDKKRPTGQYANYEDFQVNLNRVKPHWILAVDRGEAEKALTVTITLHESSEKRLKNDIVRFWLRKVHRSATDVITAAVMDGYSRLLSRRYVRECRRELTRTAHTAAAKVFGRNVRALLLTRPIRGHRVCAIDPGFANGCKIAVLDETGAAVETCTLYPHPPRNQAGRALADLERLVVRHGCDLIGIGNGTAVRETEQWVEGLRPRHPKLMWTIVSESGASVYSVSPEAEAEMPDRTPAERGAISLGRRLLDPLSELAKVEAKHLGVGMYQHDLPEKLISTTFDQIIEECVALVGVDLNTACEAVLRRVPGLNKTIAKALVGKRADVGRFTSRGDLLKIAGIGKRKFQDAVGFTRVFPTAGAKFSKAEVVYGTTGVHPESYALADAVLAKFSVSRRHVGTDAARTALRGVADGVGGSTTATDLDTDPATLKQVVTELIKDKKFDPRDEYAKPLFRESVRSLSDARVGMVLSGRVTNVSDFGAFVDVGLGVDGLVHRSKMAAPLEPGDSGDFTCIDVDVGRKRLSLSTQRQGLGASKSAHDGGSRSGTSGGHRSETVAQHRPKHRKLD